MGEMERFNATLEIKAVQMDQRLIIGYAAVASNLDRVGDILDPSALQKVVTRQKPTDISVFEGHDTTKIPLGVCLEWSFDGKGLLTTTKIFDGPAGDSALGAARGLQAVGRSLGQSIGYYTNERRFERGPDGKTLRRLLDIAIGEYSFADSTQIANTQALVQAVKARKQAGDAMDAMYEIEQQGDQWAVIATDDGDVVGLYDSREMADAVLRALASEMADDESEEDAQGKALPNAAAPYKVQLHGNEHVVTRASDGKEMSRHPSRAAAMSAVKDLMAKDAEKTTDATGGKTMPIDVNALPDASFLFVAPGTLAEDGRTRPLANRRYAYQDAEGKLAPELLTVAQADLAPTQVTDLPPLVQIELYARARRLADQATEGKTVAAETPEWQQGAALRVLGIGYQLQDMAAAIAQAQAAMRHLGEDTKLGARMQAPMRQKLRECMAALQEITNWADTVDAGQADAAKVARNAREIELLELAVA